MNPVSYIKEHPYTAGGLIVGAVVLFMLLRSGGSAPASSDAQAAADIYGINAQAQNATQQLNAAVSSHAADVGASLEALRIQSQSSENIAGLNANVELAKLNATQEITDLANTLTANVALKQIQGQTDIVTVQANQQIEQTRSITQALIAQSQNSAQVAIAATNAARDVATSCHGLGCLF